MIASYLVTYISTGWEPTVVPIICPTYSEQVDCELIRAPIELPAGSRDIAPGGDAGWGQG